MPKFLKELGETTKRSRAKMQQDRADKQSAENEKAIERAQDVIVETTKKMRAAANKGKSRVRVNSMASDFPYAGRRAGMNCVADHFRSLGFSITWENFDFEFWINWE
jgi:hypothetical protein